MNKPVLVVMAAGIGSRYGGLKQLDPVGPGGQLIIDYSVYDALRAGFETVVFIIKKELEADFHEAIGRKLTGHMEVRYAFQSMEDVPAGCSVPEGRTKPLGTAQAILCAREQVHSPFAVINADDYYGPDAFRAIYGFLNREATAPLADRYAMVGYRLSNTVSVNGHVARGVCSIGPDNVLSHIDERTRIQSFGDAIRFTEDEGASWVDLDPGSVVSMNFWGLPEEAFDEIAGLFPAFFAEKIPHNPQKAEFLLPEVIGQLTDLGKARVKALYSPDKWYGVTYREDRQPVVEAMAAMTESGLYPKLMWER